MSAGSGVRGPGSGEPEGDLRTPDTGLPASMGRWMAIDLGDRRIGIALSDPSGTIASPAGFVPRRAGHRVPLTALLAKASELGAKGFVVGLPLDERGEEGPRAAEARRLAAELAKRTGFPAELLDERYTTTAAMRAVKALHGSTRGRKGDLDAVAATVLLQFALQVRRGTQG